MAYRFRVLLPALTPQPLAGPRRDFHVQKVARDDLGVDDSYFTAGGDVVFPTLERSQRLAALLNERKAGHGEPLNASQLNAMGLLHEVFHLVIAAFRTSLAPDLFVRLRRQIDSTLGGGLDQTLRRFVEAFPPPAVYGRIQTADQYLAGSGPAGPNRELVLEELILLWLGNQNPAYAPIRELISDEPMRQDPNYLRVIQSAGEQFAREPGFGPDGQNLLDLLLAPIRHAPGDLMAQLQFMRARWGLMLQGHAELMRLLLGLDFLSEEQKWLARRGHQGPDTHDPQLSPQVFVGAEYESEPERFSPDLDWMPHVVMLAKSSFVWLDQLGKQYGRAINSLADIPDAELDLLAQRGYTALWLIGLWRRSTASRKIKVINGNPEAVASAYSLYDYEIAGELGGHLAYENLRDRCWRRGIRLASDMVPNHMGIDSAWVIEHPDWFLQTDYPPFPGHTFNGPDLSDDGRVGIYIEDGYWNKTDAAVVFKRVERHTGQVRYLYHGNDGTSMPWNDTAQLDYLKAEVREAVIQTILHVARLFPVIRFDAAMTLAKRHYQRLWFPVPGSGGDIPSRAQHAMTKERFDELFPVEFWREVVDRVAREVPDTLLLAEAFWMMEGYFVRTLGMHRVYNSAFMNMLKKEENTNYRTTLKNTLEFNPQILKRHVNFMNNPDEETAVAQFGKDDRYFGVTLLLSTLPGLPMFGHGQVEGYTERYGMEYKRAYKDERPDEQLVARHQREIVPLLRRRWLFSDVEGFFLFDFITPEGHVDEDVFAYSNRKGDQRAIILFHNKFKSTRGRIRISASYLDGAGALTQRALADALQLRAEDGLCTVYRDHIQGLDYIVENRQLAHEGLYFEFEAFKYRALIDFREVRDDGVHPWVRLSRRLAGAGVPSIDEALLDEQLRPLHEPLLDALGPGSVAYFLPAAPPTKDAASLLRVHLLEKLERVLSGLVLVRVPTLPPLSELLPRLSREYARALSPAPAAPAPAAPDAHAPTATAPAATAPAAHAIAAESRQLWLALLFLESIRATAGAPALRTLHLVRPLTRAFRDAGLAEEAARDRAGLALLVASRAGHGLATDLLALLDDPKARLFLQVHDHGGTTWFDKDRYEALVHALALPALRVEAAAPVTSPAPALTATPGALLASQLTPASERANSTRPAMASSSAVEPSPPAPESRAAAGTHGPTPATAEALIGLAADCGYRFHSLQAALVAAASQ